jgi:uncharacterized RDD family membrane protein YckC
MGEFTDVGRDSAGNRLYHREVGSDQAEPATGDPTAARSVADPIARFQSEPDHLGLDAAQAGVREPQLDPGQTVSAVQQRVPEAAHQLQRPAPGVGWRFNPAPGWLDLPSGFVPPPGWRPDPSWPAPPPGWPLWVRVQDVPAASGSIQDLAGRLSWAEPYVEEGNAARQEPRPAVVEETPPEPADPTAAAAQPAPRRLRLLAFAIDLACVTAALLVPMLIGSLMGLASPGLFTLVLVFGLIAYQSGWVWLSGGQTIGKAACNLRVYRIDGVAFAGTWRGLIWSLGRHSLVVDVFGLGFLAALGPSQRCLHDYLFSSQVITEPAGGDQRSQWLARLVRFNELLDAVIAAIAARGKRYAVLVSLWKKLSKLLKYPALVVIFLAGKASDSPLGRMWSWLQRKIAGLAAQSPPADSALQRPLSRSARAALWAGTMVSAVTVAVVAVQIPWLPGHAGPPPIIGSQFDANAEGWTVMSLPNVDMEGTVAERIRLATRPGDSRWIPSGGNPDGMLQFNDAWNDVFYFVAPRRFLGDVKAYYGGLLSFDFWVSPIEPASEPYDTADIILQGAGETLVIQVGRTVPDAWTRVGVRLDEAAGWKVDSSDGQPASRQQLRLVLGDLTALWIRGDKFSNYCDCDQGGLDNVQLGG